MPTEPPTPPTRTSEALRSNLLLVNNELDNLRKQWDNEKRQLIGEKAVLQDAAGRLNAQIKGSKEEARRAAESDKSKGINVQNVCPFTCAVR